MKLGRWIVTRKRTVHGSDFWLRYRREWAFVKAATELKISSNIWMTALDTDMMTDQD